MCGYNVCMYQKSHYISHKLANFKTTITYLHLHTMYSICQITTLRKFFFACPYFLHDEKFYNAIQYAYVPTYIKPQRKSTKKPKKKGHETENVPLFIIFQLIIIFLA